MPPSPLTYCIPKCVALLYEWEGYRICDPFHVCHGSHWGAIYGHLREQGLVTHAPRKGIEKQQLTAQVMYSVVFSECTTRHRSRVVFLWYDMRVIMAWG